MRSRVFLPILLALLTLPAAAQRRGVTETVVYATWQQDPTTTLTVHWIDDDPGTTPGTESADRGPKTPAMLTVRGLEGATERTAAATTQPVPGTTRFVHQAEVTGLTPGAAYEVRVPTDDRPRRFRTVDDDPAIPTRFALASDVYVRRKALISMHGHLAAQDPAFVLLAGDIAYAEGDPAEAGNWLDFLWCWDEYVVTHDGFSVPMIAVIGNHEVDGGDGMTLAEAPFFHKLYAFPGDQPWGVLDFGEDMSLVVLDSGHITPIAGEQARFLEETLAARQHRTHLFTSWHVPAYPSARRLASSGPRALRRHWTPLLDRYGVDAHFEGHDHAYKRTQPIRGGRIDPMGTVYVGDGGYSDLAEREPAEPGVGGWFSDRRWYLANSKKADHFEVITLTGPERRFEAIGADGQVFDAWVHVGDEPKPVVDTPVTSLASRAEFWLLLLGIPGILAFSIWWTKFTRERRRRLDTVAA